jgi:hypothetical protein
VVALNTLRPYDPAVRRIDKAHDRYSLDSSLLAFGIVLDVLY